MPAVAKACDAAAFAVAHIERKAVGAHVAVTRHAHTRALCTHDGTAFAQDVVVAVVHQHWRHQRAKWDHWQGTRKHGHVRFRVCSALSHLFDGSVCACARLPLRVCCRAKRVRWSQVPRQRAVQAEKETKESYSGSNTFGVVYEIRPPFSSSIMASLSLGGSLSGHPRARRAGKAPNT